MDEETDLYIVGVTTTLEGFPLLFIHFIRVWFTCVYLHPVSVWNPQRLGEAAGSPGTGVIVGCEPSCGC